MKYIPMGHVLFTGIMNRVFLYENYLFNEERTLINHQMKGRGKGAHSNKLGNSLFTVLQTVCDNIQGPFLFLLCLQECTEVPFLFRWEGVFHT